MEKEKQACLLCSTEVRLSANNKSDWREAAFTTGEGLCRHSRYEQGLASEFDQFSFAFR